MHRRRYARLYLKALTEQPHYTSVVAVGTAKAANETFPCTIQDINAGFDRLHRMLDGAIVDEGEQNDEDPAPPSTGHVLTPARGTRHDGSSLSQAVQGGVFLRMEQGFSRVVGRETP